MASGGHTAPEAEQQAPRVPAFRAADPAHIDLFAKANVRVWDEIAQPSTNSWMVLASNPCTRRSRSGSARPYETLVSELTGAAEMAVTA